MTSERLTDAQSAKLDEIIRFFVREKESKMHYITFGKENSNSLYANFLAAITIVSGIIYFIASEAITKLVDNIILVFGLLAGMFVATVVISVANMLQIVDYKSATHKFDVIISCLYISKISGKPIETPKLIKLMEERPKEIVDKNNLYEAWLDKVFDYIKHVNEKNTHSEMHIESSG